MLSQINGTVIRTTWNMLSMLFLTAIELMCKTILRGQGMQCYTLKTMQLVVYGVADEIN
jgi:hypothetical protein